MSCWLVGKSGFSGIRVDGNYVLWIWITLNKSLYMCGGFIV
jgi:hypothetical protein